MMPVKGFTLFELIITVAILAVLATLAAPSMSGMIGSTQIKTATGKIMDIMQQARGDAIRTGHDVTVCASTDKNSCVTTDVTRWDVGIIAKDTVDSKVYMVVDFNNANLTVTGPTADGKVTFNSTGATVGTPQVSVNKAGQSTYMICLAASGRVEAVKGTTC